MWLLALLCLCGRGASAADTEGVQLLQQKLVLKGPAEERLAAAEPLVWMHLPKCGSSFINSLIHMPGFCLGAELWTLDKNWGEYQLYYFYHALCPLLCDQRKLFCQTWDHQPIADYPSAKGRLVGVFRDPEQRILSGWHDVSWRIPAGNATLFEFAEAWRGGMAYQLTEPPETYEGDPFQRKRRRTMEDAREAARRVREGFAFVGIAEDWDLSICLFHRMFGGSCQASEFQDTRPSLPGKSSETAYDESILKGWEDDVDAVVYEAAREVFRKNLAL